MAFNVNLPKNIDIALYAESVQKGIKKNALIVQILKERYGLVSDANSNFVTQQGPTFLPIDSDGHSSAPASE